MKEGVTQSAPLVVGSPYLKSARDLLATLRVRSDIGLTKTEVQKRRRQQQPNVIPQVKQQQPILLFLERFRDPLVLFLLAAGVVSLALGEIIDAIIITGAVLLDATMSYFQVWRTQQTLERLRDHVRRMSTVLRDGSLQSIASQKLLVGDIVEFRAGERIPADARLLTSSGLRVYEGALTGESSDIGKSPATLSSRTPLGNRRNMVYLGTTVMTGSGRAVVTATGTRTEFGKIAQVLKTEKEPPTPLRRKLQKSGIRIAGIIVILVVGIAATDLALGSSLAESGRTAITLIVSAIPEDLTIILTIALTVGVVRILRHKGVVRRLSSAESLGSATVICTDKTGTLTRGEMTAHELDFLQGSVLTNERAVQEPMEELALIGLGLASDAHRAAPEERRYLGSATERTALKFVEDFGLVQSELKESWRERDAIVFDTEWKYRASLRDHPTQGTRMLFVTGAPEVLLAASSQTLNSSFEVKSLTGQWRAKLARRLVSRASDGERLLAVAVRRNMETDEVTRDDVHDLLFLGVLAIKDPIRPEVPKAIAQTQAAGVAVKLVTGDYEATARSIARDAGLTVPDEAVLTGTSLQDMDDSELEEVVDDVVVFARVNPLDKQRIVRALQARGHVVAMTGDGVNDAVALKVADIGVAMGSGKDIAKDASDLILLDDNFATIVAAIREGRVVRDNVRKVIAFLLSTNAAEVAIFLVSLLLRLPLPLLPAQILWINLVTDGTSDMALALEPEERNVMARGPESPTAPLITKRMNWDILYSGAILTLFAMTLYWYLYQQQAAALDYTRTMVFTFLAVASLLSTWSYRSLWEPIFSRGFAQNKWLLWSAGFSLALQLLAIYLPAMQRFFGTVPLSLDDWGLVFLAALIAVLLIDARKWLFRRKASVSATTTIRHKETDPTSVAGTVVG